MFNNTIATRGFSIQKAWVNTAFGVACTAAVAVLPQLAAAQDMSGVYGGLMYGREIGNDAPKSQDNAFGGFAGYNFDMGGAVVGAEFSYNAVQDADLERAMHLKGRAGMPIGDGLLYGTVGFARADVEAGGTAKGAVYGIGYDYNISENFIVGAEYLRSQYRDVGAADEDIKSNTVTLRAGFRF